MSEKNWHELSRERVYDGYRKVEKVQYELPSGRVVDFDIRRDEQVVDIMALTTANEVVLIKQFRPGPNKILLELPSGAIDGSEYHEQAAARELLEETGYAGDLELLTTYFDSPYSTMIRYFYLARNCKKVADQSLDEFEDIEVCLVSLREFRQRLRSGEIVQGKIGYIGLDILNLL